MADASYLILHHMINLKKRISRENREKNINGHVNKNKQLTKEPNENNENNYISYLYRRESLCSTTSTVKLYNFD